jgi:transcriptional regulator
MRQNPLFEVDDPAVVAELIRANPWATLVSSTSRGLVASHYPALLDEEAEGLAVLTHLGRPDDELHEIGAAGEMMLVFQGNHGYVSPGWYAPEERLVPTWNFTVAHCYGVPQPLDEEENLRVLGLLVERFERDLPEPALLDPEYGAPIARGTLGLRIPIDRFACKRKLSQNKGPETRRNVIASLREPGPYRHPELAAEMERQLQADGGEARPDPSS